MKPTSYKQNPICIYFLHFCSKCPPAPPNKKKIMPFWLYSWIPHFCKEPTVYKQPLAFLNLQLSDLTRNSKTDLKQKESKQTNKQTSKPSLYPQLPCSSSLQSVHILSVICENLSQSLSSTCQPTTIKSPAPSPATEMVTCGLGI